MNVEDSGGIHSRTSDFIIGITRCIVKIHRNREGCVELRYTDYGSGGYRFKSCRAHQTHWPLLFLGSLNGSVHIVFSPVGRTKPTGFSLVTKTSGLPYFHSAPPCMYFCQVFRLLHDSQRPCCRRTISGPALRSRSRWQRTSPSVSATIDTAWGSCGCMNARVIPSSVNSHVWSKTNEEGFVIRSM